MDQFRDDAMQAALSSEDARLPLPPPGTPTAASLSRDALVLAPPDLDPDQWRAPNKTEARLILDYALAAHGRDLTSYAVRLLSDEDQAQDAVQETFLRLVRAMGQQAGASRGPLGEQHLGPWLFKVCRNICVDARRKEQRMQPMTAEIERRPTSQSGPDEKAERQEQQSAVLRALDTLNENQREVILLKFQYGLAYKEICQITGLTVSYVGVLIHTGLKDLRLRLNPSVN
jgi:RNA polymerase sigma factor (sigma-70 family)